MTTHAKSKPPFRDHNGKTVRKCSSWWGHNWEHRYGSLNGGLYHQGAIGREGWMCDHCAAVVFADSDQEHFDSMPEWLRKEIADQNPANRQPRVSS